MNFQRSNIFMSAALGALLVAGCASAPSEPVAELAEATALVQQADSAGAGQFAAGPLASARTELTRAQELSDDGKQAAARQSAQRASADARLAIAAAERAKAEKAANDSDAALRALRAETQRSATN
jgi:hypothetical protein